MEYTEVNIRLKEVEKFADILVARLDDIEFESFVEDGEGLKAYVQTEFLDGNAVNDILSEFSKLTDISFTINKLNKQNWNAEWESNYQPVFINKNCVIRAHFHNAISDVEYEVIVTPKMSFGTGHHETTALMINEMFAIDFKGKSVLDMGSGTGVLSIMASKLGASDIVGIDIDQWAFENARENAALNQTTDIKFIHANANAIPDSSFDIILANINRNVLLQDIYLYVDVMSNASEMILSGFLIEDASLILNLTEQLGLSLVVEKNKNKWQMLRLRKG